jgi:hypothetical protein
MLIVMSKNSAIRAERPVTVDGWRHVPETKGRSLQELEHDLNGRVCLADRLVP